MCTHVNQKGLIYSSYISYGQNFSLLLYETHKYGFEIPELYFKKTIPKQRMDLECSIWTQGDHWRLKRFSERLFSTDPMILSSKCTWYNILWLSLLLMACSLPSLVCGSGPLYTVSYIVIFLTWPTAINISLFFTFIHPSCMNIANQTN